ncbi:MAG: hypothetical protein GY788_02350, partial [bacterium]|nr:hypothetical protein [bacterium]
MFLQVGSGKNPSVAMKAWWACGYNDPLNKQDPLGLRPSEEEFESGVGSSVIPVPLASHVSYADLVVLASVPTTSNVCGRAVFERHTVWIEWMFEWPTPIELEFILRENSRTMMTANYSVEWRAAEAYQHMVDGTNIDVYEVTIDFSGGLFGMDIDVKKVGHNNSDDRIPRDPEYHKPWYAHT